jgi:restriction system protein
MPTSIDKRCELLGVLEEESRMSRALQYSEVVENEFLGKSKVVKASSFAELQIRIAEQHERWRKEEERVRQRDAIQDLKAKAEAQTAEAQSLIEDYRTILQHTLPHDDRIVWKDLYDVTPFSAPLFEKTAPDHANVAIELGVPEPSWTEVIFKSKKQRRLELAERARAEFESRLSQYHEQKAAHKDRTQQAKREHEKQIHEQNAEIDQFKAGYENGVLAAVERYTSMVLNRSEYPDEFNAEFATRFTPESQTLVVDYHLPTPDELPRVEQHRFVQSRKAIEPVDMKAKVFDAFYDSVIYQVTIRTIHEIFEADYSRNIQSVVFNGWVSGVDKATGKDFSAYLVSCQASREQFEEFDLSRVNPKETFRALKGLVAGPLSQLAPVRPIMQINREDSRFIEGREILSGIDPSQNLATMHWDDFEHLVRELFSKIFSSGGGEVRVTQASRDGGIDAVAFDPDPIRGGKFVIQAKRYVGLVSVSAVRDLYGTMINEGAVKGILVTTGHFGNDSREFVKDKPIALIESRLSFPTAWT